jgi:hypothetical protein
LTSAAAEQQSATWFGCLGTPLAAADLVNSRAYLDALGYPPELSTVSVENWREAERIVRAPDWDSGWWEREERERDRLRAAVERRLGSTQMLERLTAATDQTADPIHAAAIVAMARTGSGADAMVRAASGAAMMAAHEFALAQLAGCGPDHLFMRKYSLFKSGRWPLGVLRGAFYLF